MVRILKYVPAKNYAFTIGTIIIGDIKHECNTLSGRINQLLKLFDEYDLIIKMDTLMSWRGQQYKPQMHKEMKIKKIIINYLKVKNDP